MMSNHSSAAPMELLSTALRASAKRSGVTSVGVAVRVMVLLRDGVGGRGALGAEVAEEVGEEGVAALDLLDRDELVRRVGLRDVAGAADDGRDAGALEEAGL